MFPTIGKILALLIALAYAMLAIHHQGWTGLEYSASLLLPLALIWFPEEIGDLTGFFPTGYVNVQTPGIIITLIGWFILVGIPVIFYLLHKYN